MLKVLARFFTHWTKKKVIITAISALCLTGVSFGAYQLVGKKAGLDSLPTIESSENTALDRPSDKSVVDFLSSEEDFRYNLYVAQGELKRAGSFKSVSKGATVSAGITQEILATRVVSGKSVFKDSVSYGFKKIGDQRFAHDGNYVYRAVSGGKYVKAIDDVTYTDDVKVVGESAFEDRYGCIGNELCGYLLRDDTIIAAAYEGYDEESGLYTFSYQLDVSPDKAVYYILSEMKTNAGADKYPEFVRAKIIVSMTDDWRVATLTTDCEYKVVLPVFPNGVTCKESMTETFSDFGNYPSVEDIPEYSYFSQYFNAEITEEPEEKELTALDAIMSAFGKYLDGKTPLNLDFSVSDGDGDPINVSASAIIDIEDLASISVAAKIGEKDAEGGLTVSYKNGKVGLFYGDFKTVLTIDDDFNSLISGLIGGGDFSDVDLDGIIDDATLSVEGEKCVITMPINIGSFAITVTMNCKTDGTIVELENACVAIGDFIAVTAVVSDETVVAPDMSDVPELNALLYSLIREKTGFAVNVGDTVIYATVDPISAAINAEFGDLKLSACDGFAYVDTGLGKWKIDLKTTFDALKAQFGGLSDDIDLSIGDVLGLFAKIETRLEETGACVYADFDGVSFEILFGQTAQGDLTLEGLDVNVKDALTLSTCDYVVDNPKDLESYVCIDVASAIKDILPGIMEIVDGQTLVLGVDISGVEINGYLKFDIDGKKTSLRVPELYGASLDGEIGLGTAYFAYGNINAYAEYDGLNGILSKVEDWLGLFGVSTSGFDEIEIDVESLVNAVLGATKIPTDDGYVLVIKLYVGDKAADLKVKVVDNAFNELIVGFGNAEISLGVTDEEVEFVTPSTENAVEVFELIDSVLPQIKNLVKANGYEIGVDGLEIVVGESEVVVNGKVYIQKQESGVEIRVNCEISVDGGKFVKAEIIVVNGKVYAEVNGYRLALEIGEESVSGIEISQLKGYNEYVDGIIAAIEEISEIDLSSIEYGKIVKELTYSEGEIRLVADGSQFKLGEEITLKIGINDGVSVIVSGVEFGGIGISGEVGVKAYEQEISAPQGDDYVTNIKVAIDFDNVLHASLDFINGVYEFDLVSVSADDSSKTVSLSAKYVNETIYLKIGDTVVECSLIEMEKIIDEFTRLANPTGDGNSQEGSVSVSNTDIDALIKEIISGLTLDGTTVKTQKFNLFGLLNMGVKLSVVGEYDTKIEICVDELGLTLVATSGEDHAYADFNGAQTVNIGEVFNDYFDILKELVTVDAETGVKGWTFSIGEITVDKNGTQDVIKPFKVELQYSADKVRVVTDDILIYSVSTSMDGVTSQTLKSKFAVDVAYVTEVVDGTPESRLYVTYNDRMNNGKTGNDSDEEARNASALRVSVSRNALSGLINALPELFDVVPELKDLMTDKISVNDVLNLATLISKVGYNNGELSATIDLTSFGLTAMTLKVYKTGGEDGVVNGIALALESDAFNVSSVAVSVNPSIVSVDDIGYDLAQPHFNLDSVETLLRAFIKTADRTTFRLKGDIPVNLNAIGFINVDVTLAVDIQIDIEKDENGKDVVYIAAKLARGNLQGKTAAMAFADYGGDSYLCYDGANNLVTVKRNAIVKHNYCEKCDKYDCDNFLHGFNKNDVYLQEISYDTTVTGNEFTANFVDYLFEMINFSDTIEKLIRDALAGESQVYGIDDLITAYTYTAKDENNESPSFNATINLAAIDDVMGDLSVNIYHADNYDLTYLDGSVTLLDITGVKCVGTFRVDLVESDYGVAKNLVEDKTLF